MSQRSKNQEKVNDKLMELNRKFIPEYDVILNSSPPRVGKTINTILYHIENNIPAIVFIDNENQANDIIEDLREINEKHLTFLHYWQSKEKTCYIFLNEDEIIEKEGKEFFETLKFKHENNIYICKNCKYTENCNWKSQRRLIKMYNIVLMNKANIFTPIVDIRKTFGNGDMFYYHDLDKVIDESIDYNFFDEDPRTIIFDEKIEEIHIIKYRKLKDNDFKLLNKIIELKKPELNINIQSDREFINIMEDIKNIFVDYGSVAKLLEESDIDFTSFGKREKGIYVDLFLQKIKTNIEICEYLMNKYQSFGYDWKGLDWEFFTSEKLYIDALFERNEIIRSMKKDDKINKIILLDATPLKPLVERLKRMEGLEEMDLDLEIFDKNSSLLRIYREGRPSMAPRYTIKKRIFKDGIETDVLEDKFYDIVVEVKRYIDEFKKLKDIKFGVITYMQLKRGKNDENPIKPFEELKKLLKNIYTLYFGNSRGRSELNDCEILHIVGTDRHPPISMYNLYRYLGGRKTWKELETIEGRVEKLTYNDKLFNEIINHQIDSEMEQVIFRNMPHMKKRFTILEGHLPEHLKEYFKEVANINMKPTAEKLLFPIVIKEFLKTLYYKKEFNFKEVNKIAKLSFDDDKKILGEFNKIVKEDSVKKVIKLIEEYRTKPENYTFEKIYNILKEENPELIKKAKMSSFSSFKNKYNSKK